MILVAVAVLVTLIIVGIIIGELVVYYVEHNEKNYLEASTGDFCSRM